MARQDDPTAPELGNDKAGYSRVTSNVLIAPTAIAAGKPIPPTTGWGLRLV